MPNGILAAGEEISLAHIKNVAARMSPATFFMAFLRIVFAKAASGCFLYFYFNNSVMDESRFIY